MYNYVLVILETAEQINIEKNFEKNITVTLTLQRDNLNVRYLYILHGVFWLNTNVYDCMNAF